MKKNLVALTTLLLLAGAGCASTLYNQRNEKPFVPVQQSATSTVHLGP